MKSYRYKGVVIDRHMNAYGYYYNVIDSRMATFSKSFSTLKSAKTFVRECLFAKKDNTQNYRFNTTLLTLEKI